MKVVEQLCVKSFEVTAKNGDHWKAEQGAFYTTTIPEESERHITVFSNYWVKVPKEHFVLKEEPL
jgi:hypothetical protein